jgi:hypothetical protein
MGYFGPNSRSLFFGVLLGPKSRYALTLHKRKGGVANRFKPPII